MKDLNPSGKGKTPPENETVVEDYKPLEKIENLGTTSPVLNLEELAQEDLEDFANEALGPDVDILEDQPQDTDYLEEGSEAQHKALKTAVNNDIDAVVDHDYGSSEWLLVTSAINEKIGYRSYTHAMPLGDKGRGGCIVKTLTIQQGNCSVHTFIDRSLRVLPDPEAVNLYILK